MQVQYLKILWIYHDLTVLDLLKIKIKIIKYNHKNFISKIIIIQISWKKVNL